LNTIPLLAALPLWLFPFRNPTLRGVTIAIGIYQHAPLYSVGVHIWIFRNQGVVAEQQDQDIPLEGLVVEEPPTPLQPISEAGTETETIARTNSQADNSYLAPPTPSQVQEQISRSISEHTGSSQTTSSRGADSRRNH